MAPGVEGGVPVVEAQAAVRMEAAEVQEVEMQAVEMQGVEMAAVVVTPEQ